MSDVTEFSFADPATLACPHAYYTAMRKEGPVHRDPAFGMFVVSKYADILEVVKQPGIFSSAQGFEEMLRKDYTPEIDAMMTRDGFGPLPLAVWDPPEHTRIRKLMDKAFTPKRVETMESYVVDIMNDLIDAIEDKGETDMMSDIAIPLPIYVIADQLGVDRADRDLFKHWSDISVEPLTGMITRERAFECARETIELQKYLKARIDDRRENPRDDMISDLVHAKLTDDEGVDGDVPTLNETELFAVIRGFLVAGNETTTNGIANALRLLAEIPALAEALRARMDENRVLANFVEEVLRIESPVPNLFRLATEDTSIGGIPIPKGSHVLLAWASANRDETRFECPAEFQADRKNAGHHLAFGAGIHRCIGQALARMEMKIAVREILRRLDNLELATAADDIDYPPSLVTHGPTKLPLRFKKRVSA